MDLIIAKMNVFNFDTSDELMEIYGTFLGGLANAVSITKRLDMLQDS